MNRTPDIPHHATLTERSWPFLGSFTLHAILIAILSSPSLQYPATMTPQAPNFIWLSPFVPPSDEGDSGQTAPGPVVAFAAQQVAPESALSDQSADNPDDTGHPADLPDTQVTIVNSPAASADAELIISEARTAKPAAIAEKPPVPTPALLSSTPANVTAKVENPAAPLESEPAPQRLAQHSSLAEQLVPVQAEENSSPEGGDALQDGIDRISSDISDLKRLVAAATRQEQMVREKEQRAIRKRLDRKHAAAEKSRQMQAARERRKLRDQEDALRKQEKERARREKSEQVVLSAAATPQNKTVQKASERERSEQRPPNQPEKPKAMVMPHLKGDLKLVLGGVVLPEASITFKEFAPSRRNRPFSRAESRREIKVVPLMATPQDNIREIAIGQVNPGVYTITVEPADGPADVVITLTLYEGTSRMIKRDLGRHALARKKVLLKILMPEGILWDDNAAFTGNMEDSGGITKFNSETGLVWKEFIE